MTHVSASRSILRQFWSAGEERPMWGIFDCARERHIYSTIIDSYLTYECLYLGDLPPELERAAPYLVKLENGDKPSRQLIEMGWGRSWGIFAQAKVPASELRRHFRKFLIVRGPTGKKLLFRYYDPRVFRAFLPTCNADELRLLFGPVDTFWVESRDPDEAIRFRISSSGGLLKETVSLR